MRGFFNDAFIVFRDHQPLSARIQIHLRLPEIPRLVRLPVFLQCFAECSAAVVQKPALPNSGEVRRRQILQLLRAIAWSVGTASAVAPPASHNAPRACVARKGHCPNVTVIPCADDFCGGVVESTITQFDRALAMAAPVA